MLSEFNKPYYKAENLAKYIIGKCIAEGVPIPNLQLQRILYCIQREFLRLDIILLEDDFEAWKFGPCVKDVYYTYCGYGGLPIRMFFKYEKIDLIKEFKIIVDRIIETTRSKKPWDLAAEVCQEGGAWDIIFKKTPITCGDYFAHYNIIPKELIQEKG